MGEIPVSVWVNFMFTICTCMHTVPSHRLQCDVLVELHSASSDMF